MPIDELTPAEIRIVLLASERVCGAFNLTDQDTDLPMRSRISAFILECAKGGEREVQKLIDSALIGIEKDKRQGAPN